MWLLVVYGSYSIVEKIFLVACGFYLSYVAVRVPGQARLALCGKRNGESLHTFEAPYLADAHRLVGTTIAPWQFFYLQAGFVEKRVGPRQYKHAAWTCLSAASPAW